MIFNIIYDQSLGSLPAGFVTTINAVVNFFQSTFTDSATVNIDVGFGEVHGQTLSQVELDKGYPTSADAPNILPHSPLLSAGALGASSTYLASFSYSQITTALTKDASSGDDASAVLSLPGSDPAGGHDWVTSAE